MDQLWQTILLGECSPKFVVQFTRYFIFILAKCGCFASSFLPVFPELIIRDTDSLVQDCSISTATALEILQSCTKPSLWWSIIYLCNGHAVRNILYNRNHFVYALSQWETMLHCNVVSHWLGAYTKWPLLSYVTVLWRDPIVSSLGKYHGWWMIVHYGKSHWSLFPIVVSLCG